MAYNNMKKTILVVVAALVLLVPALAYAVPTSVNRDTVLHFIQPLINTDGFMANATSTIGDGTAVGGLTVSGNATTSLKQYIAGTLGVGAQPGTLAIDASSNDATAYTGSTLPTSRIRITNTNSTDNNFSQLGLATNDTNGLISNGVLLNAIFTSHTPSAVSSDFAVTTRNVGTMTEKLRLASGGAFGVGTTSPFAKLSVQANPTDSVLYTNLFAVASSTAAATTTLFSVDNVGTTTLLRFDATGATSTMANSLTIAAGTVRIPDGTLGLPGISFNGSTNTGLRQSSNLVVVTTAGTDRWSIGSSIASGLSAGGSFSNADGRSTTVPTLLLDRADATTGFAAGTFGNVVAIVNSSEVARFATSSLGVGSTTPNATLSVMNRSNFMKLVSFEVGSSTSAATTTHFQITNTGAIFTPALSTSVTGNAVCITSAGQLTNAGAAACVPSSEKFKQNVKPLMEDISLKEVMALKPSAYEYKEEFVDPSEKNYSFGFIAEEVEKVDPTLVDYGYDKQPLSLHFDRILARVTSVVQWLVSRDSAQQKQIDDLTNKVEILQKQIDSLTR